MALVLMAMGEDLIAPSLKAIDDDPITLASVAMTTSASPIATSSPRSTLFYL